MVAIDSAQAARPYIPKRIWEKSRRLDLPVMGHEDHTLAIPGGDGVGGRMRAARTHGLLQAMAQAPIEFT